MNDKELLMFEELELYCVRHKKTGGKHIYSEVLADKYNLEDDDAKAMAQRIAKRMTTDKVVDNE